MPRSRLLRFAVTGAVLAATASCLWASAPSPMTPSLGVAVDVATTIPLPGSVSPRLLAATDLGEAPADRRLTSMSLRFSLSAAQQTALTQLLADQQNPASPRYRQWLTPEQYAAQFGLATSDLSKVTAWLSAQGFTVTEIARGASFVRFSGSVAQAEAAFHTQIHTVSLHGKQHVANITAPQLPSALAAVTTAVTGLDDFHPKARPEFTNASTGQHYLAPGDFYTIYDEKNLISSNVTGTGVTIAVIGQTDIAAADIASFQAAAGLANKPVTVMLYGADPGSTTSDLFIADMDLEWAGAVAPGAGIVFVTSADVLDGSLTEAIDNSIGSVIVSSYGACEASLGTGPLAFYTQLLSEASSQGISITAGSGNYGATDCDTADASAVNGSAVDFPASSPQVTGIGGTTFTGTGTYWSTTNGANAGSALSYIPEVVWNGDSSSGLSATGGGASQYFSKPAWQLGTGVPNDFSRDVPDIALNASAGYLVCSNSNCTNGFANASGTYLLATGTTMGAPLFGGLLALVEQKTGGHGLGNANPVIYALANSTYAGSVFHDITSGTNASPCTAGTVGCGASGAIGFAATAGYDQATGWGSVDAYALVNDWSLVTPVVSTTGNTPTFTTLAGSANSVTTGTSIVFTVTVASATAGSTTTPTGTAQLTINGVALGSAITLASGTQTYTLNTSAISAGKYVVQATYLGDSTYAGSKGQFSITIVAPGAPDFTLSPSTAMVTVASGNTAPAVTFTVTELNGFAGSVSFSASVATALNAQYSFTVNPVVLNTTTTTGSTALSLFAFTQNARGAAHFGPVAGLSGISRQGRWYGAGSGVALAGLLLFVLPRRRRFTGLLVLVLSLAAVGSFGCASPSPAKAAASNINPTPAGTYTVVVQATGVLNGVTSSHVSTLTFVVQ